MAGERDLEYQSWEETREILVRHLRELMAGPWMKAPALQRRLAEKKLAARDLATFADLARFPRMKKSDLPSLQAGDPPFGGLLAVPHARLRRIFASPGPIHEPEGDLPSYWRWERALAAAGFAAGDVVLNCLGYHLTPAGAMFDEACRNLGCPVIPGGIGNAEIQADTARHCRATGYIGLPSYLKAMLDKAGEAGKKLPFRKAFVLAEKLPERLRDELQARGIIVRQGYGTAELGAVAYECAEADGFHLDPSVLVELLDPASGEPVPAGTPGEVVVTPLNPVYALLRFGTGDLSILDPAPCPCGRETPRLLGVLGRVDAATKVRGLFLHPEQLAPVFAAFPAVTAWRAAVVRERAMDDLILEVEGEGTLHAPVLQAIAARAKEALKLTARVVQVPSGTIPAGKPIDDRRKWD
jgi:phenylacetate-CoA ligase